MSRSHQGRRPRGVYTSADFGPLVNKFERTQFGAREDGTLVGAAGGPANEEHAAEMDGYVVDEYLRGAMKNFGCEKPMAESDRPRDTRTNPMSSLKLRRTFAVNDVPEHPEMNFSHMGPDPRGTATEPDARMARRIVEGRSAYMEKTLGGQDSAVQQTGDSRPSENEMRDRRNAAIGVLRGRKKIFATAQGNVIRGAKAPDALRSQYDAVLEEEKYGGGAGAGAEMYNDVARPVNATTMLGAATPLGLFGGVPDHQFAIASYADTAATMVPVADAPSAAAGVVADADMTASAETRNVRAAMAVKEVMSAALQTHSEADMLGAARETIAGGAAAALAGLVPHAAGMTRQDADLAMAQIVDTFAGGAGSAAPMKVIASNTAIGVSAVDQADMADTAQARLAATEAVARAAKSVMQSRDLGKLTQDVGEMSRADFEAALLGESRSQRGKSAAPASASAVAKRSRQGRNQQRFAAAKEIANYAAAPVLANAGQVSAARNRAVAPLNDQTRVTVQGKSAAMSADGEKVRRSALVESGSFGLDGSGSANTRAPGMMGTAARARGQMQSARGGLMEAPGFGGAQEGRASRGMEMRA